MSMSMYAILPGPQQWLRQRLSHTTYLTLCAPHTFLCTVLDIMHMWYCTASTAWQHLGPRLRSGRLLRNGRQARGCGAAPLGLRRLRRLLLLLFTLLLLFVSALTNNRNIASENEATGSTCCTMPVTTDLFAFACKRSADLLACHRRTELAAALRRGQAAQSGKLCSRSRSAVASLVKTHVSCGCTPPLCPHPLPPPQRPARLQ